MTETEVTYPIHYTYIERGMRVVLFCYPESATRAHHVFDTVNGLARCCDCDHVVDYGTEHSFDPRRFEAADDRWLPCTNDACPDTVPLSRD